MVILPILTTSLNTFLLGKVGRMYFKLEQAGAFLFSSGIVVRLIGKTLYETYTKPLYYYSFCRSLHEKPFSSRQLFLTERLYKSSLRLLLPRDLRFPYRRLRRRRLFRRLRLFRLRIRLRLRSHRSRRRLFQRNIRCLRSHNRRFRLYFRRPVKDAE